MRMKRGGIIRVARIQEHPSTGIQLEPPAKKKKKKKVTYITRSVVSLVACVSDVHHAYTHLVSNDM